MVADDDVQGEAALGSKPLELVPEDDVALGEHAVDDHELAADLLDERANRSDPDPAGDQHDLLDGGGSGL